MNRIKQIWPRWEPMEVIGRGGFGTVYKAKREHFGEVSYSAIKIVKIPSDEYEVNEMSTAGMSKENIRDYYYKSVLNLVDEIKLMEKMKSASHIVGIEDYEVVENETGIGWTVYIRMELLTNITAYFQSKEPSVEAVKKMAADVLTALDYCHQMNIIHRDIKPGNIFVSEFGEYKLGDFGISREVERTNATMSQKGTKSYMAPEMIRMSKYGKNVDLYALGLTMYELLNHGRMPFLPPFPEPFYPQDRENATLKRLEGVQFPDIEGIGALNDVIKKACHFDATKRYQSASEMKADLFSEVERTQTSDFSLFEEPTQTTVAFQNDEKTQGVFSSGFMFEDTQMTSKTEEQKQTKRPLEPLHVKCPHCGKEAYLVAPKVYICNDCWKMVRMDDSQKTIQLSNLYVEIGNNVSNPQLQLEKAKEMDRLAPLHAQTIMRLGLYYGKNGNQQKKKELYELALGLDDRDAVIYNNVALLIDDTEPFRSMDLYSKAISLQKKGSTTAAYKEGLFNANYAISLEKNGSSLAAFRALQSAHRYNYDNCTALLNDHNVGVKHCQEKLAALLRDYKVIPNCFMENETILNTAKETFSVNSHYKVMGYLNPKLLFGGKKQGIVLCDRAFYFFDNGKPLYIPYYKLGNLTFKADRQGHIQFKYTQNKNWFDVQFGQDAKAVVEFFTALKRALGFIIVDDILDMFKKK